MNASAPSCAALSVFYCTFTDWTDKIPVWVAFGGTLSSRMFEEPVGTVFLEISSPPGSSTGWRDMTEPLWPFSLKAEVIEGTKGSLELGAARSPGVLRERGSNASTSVGTLFT